jgi:hypothetical protein
MGLGIGDPFALGELTAGHLGRAKHDTGSSTLVPAQRACRHVDRRASAVECVGAPVTPAPVTPVVYDIAKGRSGGNKYAWTAKGGGKSYNSSAAYS